LRPNSAALRVGAFSLYFIEVTPRERKVKAIVSKLLNWYPKNARDLPWRRTTDPYSVFVSEIMLQQTQVKTVIPFWERWMRELPTLHSLAKARPQKIHKLWEGLGYYTRVRNMQKAARLILERHGGLFPTTFEDILALPGVGRYTAGAICSIAFNQPRPILDGNVIRVLTRLFGIAGNPKEKAINAKLWDLAEQLVLAAAAHPIHAEQSSQPKDPESSVPNRKSQIANRKSQCSHLNQSLMELGALVCTARGPHCELCPVASHCSARRHGKVEVLPALPPRQRPTKRRFVAFIVQNKGRFLVRQRRPGIVNGNLWEFPNIEVPLDDGNPEQAAVTVLGCSPQRIEHFCSIQHSITRYRIRLDAIAIRSKKVECSEGRWLNPQDLRRLPFTSAHKKILARL